MLGKALGSRDELTGKFVQHDTHGAGQILDLCRVERRPRGRADVHIGQHRQLRSCPRIEHQASNLVTTTMSGFWCLPSEPRPHIVAPVRCFEQDGFLTVGLRRFAQLGIGRASLDLFAKPGSASDRTRKNKIATRPNAALRACPPCRHRAENVRRRCRKDTKLARRSRPALPWVSLQRSQTKHKRSRIQHVLIAKLHGVVEMIALQIGLG